MMFKSLYFFLILALSFPASAALSPETSYVINTFVLLICSALIMWMVAGFCMLESGLVSTKSTAVICLKNVLIYSISCICFYVLGYNIMFTDVGSWAGSFSFFANMQVQEINLIEGAVENLNQVIKGGSSSIARVFFQMTFVATTASVISGVLAERIKLWPFFLFVILLTTVIYPIQGAWTWGGGWLSQLGFVDFAGSTVVHSVGGWAALTGAFFLGARRDKYGENGEVKTYFPSSVPFVSLGVFILWLGWLGFNGGSLLVTAGGVEISKMALIFMNTNIAACSGVIFTLLVGKLVYGRLNILLILNGALAGLVSITAGPDFSQPLYAIFIGGIGGVLATLTVPLLDKLKIDDVVGAIPVHLVAGIWGTLAVGIWGPAQFSTQLIGVLSIGAFVFITTGAFWFALKKTVGIRVSEDLEDLGQDLLELGLESEPDILGVKGVIS